jgi:hypothetical protein
MSDKPVENAERLLLSIGQNASQLLQVVFSPNSHYQSLPRQTGFSEIGQTIIMSVLNNRRVANCGNPRDRSLRCGSGRGPSYGET